MGGRLPTEGCWLPGRSGSAAGFEVAAGGLWACGAAGAGLLAEPGPFIAAQALGQHADPALVERERQRLADTVRMIESLTWELQNG